MLTTLKYIYKHYFLVGGSGIGAHFSIVLIKYFDWEPWLENFLILADNILILILVLLFSAAVIVKIGSLVYKDIKSDIQGINK